MRTQGHDKSQFPVDESGRHLDDPLHGGGRSSVYPHRHHGQRKHAVSTSSNARTRPFFGHRVRVDVAA